MFVRGYIIFSRMSGTSKELGNIFNVLLFACFVICIVGQTPEPCYECKGETWDKCTGVDHVCRLSERCVSAMSEMTQELAGSTSPSSTKMVRRRCAGDAMCDKDISANFRVGAWKIKTSCGANVTLGNEKLPKSGLKCYGCVASTGSYCTQTVDCDQSQMMCISSTETVAGKVLVNRGCATQTMCDLRKDITEVIGPVVVGEVNCCTGSLCNGSVMLKFMSSIAFLPLITLSLMAL